MTVPGKDQGSRVVVLGGGATGCAVARDLVMRRFDVTLVEFGDLGSGTSSRFHGMLQSGARYAVSDTSYASECMRERRIIADIIPDAVESTGGLFVSLPEDPPDFAERFVEGCRRAEIPCDELDPDRVMAEEPDISRRICRAFAVPDASVDPWRLVNRLAEDVTRRGGRVLTRCRVTGIDVSGGAVRAVRIAGDGSEDRIETDAIVNAAGPWSARVAAMVDQTVDLELTKGSIIGLSHRLVRRVVNRCRPPASHDIIVPAGTVSLFGTTSEVVDDPDTTLVTPADVQELLDGAEALVPGIRRRRAYRAWAGVRPLVKPKGWPPGTPLPRRHLVIDHANTGVMGFFTVCGGSLTTHRAMAQDVSDHVCRRFGVSQACRTHTTRLSPGPRDTPWRPIAGHAAAETKGTHAQMLCECEAVDRSVVTGLIEEAGIARLHDLRRRLRIGFGPCQGTFCAVRAADLLAGADNGFPVEASIGRFWTERLKGVAKTAWGDQARQALLSDIVHREILGIRLRANLLPAEDCR